MCGGKGNVSVSTCILGVGCLNGLQLALGNIPDNDLLGVLSRRKRIGNTDGCRSAKIADHGIGGDRKIIDGIIAQERQLLLGKCGILNGILLCAVGKRRCRNADILFSCKRVFDALI